MSLTTIRHTTLARFVRCALASTLVLSFGVAAADGLALYKRSCALCHDNAIGGAPKLSDKANWASRFKAGTDAMTASVIKGKGTMPPRAGTKLTDAEIRTAVEYMAVATR